MDYRIFNAHTWSFCMCGRWTSVYSLIRRAFVESAQKLTPEKSAGGRKAWHITVNRPVGDHARSCLTLAFESEYSCSAPLTLQWQALLDVHIAGTRWHPGRRQDEEEEEEEEEEKCVYGVPSRKRARCAYKDIRKRSSHHTHTHTHARTHARTHTHTHTHTHELQMHALLVMKENSRSVCRREEMGF